MPHMEIIAALIVALAVVALFYLNSREGCACGEPTPPGSDTCEKCRDQMGIW